MATAMYRPIVRKDIETILVRLMEDEHDFENDSEDIVETDLLHEYGAYTNNEDGAQVVFNELWWWKEEDGGKLAARFQDKYINEVAELAEKTLARLVYDNETYEYRLKDEYINSSADPFDTAQEDIDRFLDGIVVIDAKIGGEAQATVEDFIQKYGDRE